MEFIHIKCVDKVVRTDIKLGKQKARGGSQHKDVCGSKKPLKLVPTREYLTIMSNKCFCMEQKHAHLKQLLINYKHSLPGW